MSRYITHSFFFLDRLTMVINRTRIAKLPAILSGAPPLFRARAGPGQELLAPLQGETRFGQEVKQLKADLRPKPGMMT